MRISSFSFDCRFRVDCLLCECSLRTLAIRSLSRRHQTLAIVNYFVSMFFLICAINWHCASITRTNSSPRGKKRNYFGNDQLMFISSPFQLELTHSVQMCFNAKFPFRFSFSFGNICNNKSLRLFITMPFSRCLFIILIIIIWKCLFFCTSKMSSAFRRKCQYDCQNIIHGNFIFVLIFVQLFYQRMIHSVHSNNFG